MMLLYLSGVFLVFAIAALVYFGWVYAYCKRRFGDKSSARLVFNMAWLMLLALISFKPKKQRGAANAR